MPCLVTMETLMSYCLTEPSKALVIIFIHIGLYVHGHVVLHVYAIDIKLSILYFQ